MHAPTATIVLLLRRAAQRAGTVRLADAVYGCQQWEADHPAWDQRGALKS
jgi:hypothetical protein